MAEYTKGGLCRANIYRAGLGGLNTKGLREEKTLRLHTIEKLNILINLLAYINNIHFLMWSHSHAITIINDYNIWLKQSAMLIYFSSKVTIAVLTTDTSFCLNLFNVI